MRIAPRVWVIMTTLVTGSKSLFTPDSPIDLSGALFDGWDPKYFADVLADDSDRPMHAMSPSPPPSTSDLPPYHYQHSEPAGYSASYGTANYMGGHANDHLLHSRESQGLLIPFSSHFNNEGATAVPWSPHIELPGAMAEELLQPLRADHHDVPASSRAERARSCTLSTIATKFKCLNPNDLAYIHSLLRESPDSRGGLTPDSLHSNTNTATGALSSLHNGPPFTPDPSIDISVGSLDGLDGWDLEDFRDVLADNGSPPMRAVSPSPPPPMHAISASSTPPISASHHLSDQDQHSLGQDEHSQSIAAPRYFAEHAVDHLSNSLESPGYWIPFSSRFKKKAVTGALSSSHIEQPGATAGNPLDLSGADNLNSDVLSVLSTGGKRKRRNYGLSREAKKSKGLRPNQALKDLHSFRATILESSATNSYILDDGQETPRVSRDAYSDLNPHLQRFDIETPPSDAYDHFSQPIEGPTKEQNEASDQH
ncbi:hypothetical protein PTTG_03705 [Puccinia triticina 1-1 BBBD Race 1]|uniref:Uncharacterized protein n=1 Tax=Puccinia triticina (isolate 1-1 / race 1 (BBBD)) TaxID=630390 RepID=A0A0C4ESD1_PUCT1|nr:hypothetical protein PTTG_03705 [Puccinia triticina 1-1 BBBD Race 1]